MKLHDEWLLKALHDLKSSKKLISGKDPIFDTSIYHTQQCAEKALKSFLAFNKKSIPKSHDIQLLIEQCIEIDQDFEELYDIGMNLTPFATFFRYPGHIIEPDIEDVNEAIIIAEKIFHFVKNKTNSDI